MDFIYCFAVGSLFSVAVYLMLQASMIRIFYGLIILSTAVNLLIFVLGGINYSSPAFISHKNPMTAWQHFANPLPQALILTAIVIGFGLFSYCLVLIRCLWQYKRDLKITDDTREV
jgi:multicomponent Na+:H+ antiporter subunit C